MTQSGGRQPTFVAARICYWITSSAVANSVSGTGFGQKVFVLGNDGNLWWEPWPTGDVVQTIAERQIIDSNVQAFQALDVYDVIVLGSDGNLWFEGLPFGSIAQTIQNRKQIDANVKAFQPIDAYKIYVLGSDGTLWFEPWPVPANSPSFDGWGNVQDTIINYRKMVDQNVAAFQAIDLHTVFVLPPYYVCSWAMGEFCFCGGRMRWVTKRVRVEPAERLCNTARSRWQRSRSGFMWSRFEA
jgi:hypothetical protein